MATLQPPSPPPAPHVYTVMSEGNRIIKAHRRHFYALSALFLLPLGFSSFLFPTLIDHIPKYSRIFIVLTDFPAELGQSIIPTKTLLLFLAYSLITLLFFLCAIGSITYSVFHFFYGQQVKLISAIKSISASFFPLLGTVIVFNIIAFAITIPFLIILFLAIRGAELLGLETESSSSYFRGLLLILSIVLILVLLYLIVILSLAYVVVVVESKWGLQSLRRSASLLKGMKRVAFSLWLIFMILEAMYLWQVVFLLDSGDGWKTWDWSSVTCLSYVTSMVLGIVSYPALLALLMLCYLASNTVLYMYCKAIHGELAFGKSEEFGREYVSLPVNDEKVPHVAPVVCP